MQQEQDVIKKLLYRNFIVERLIRKDYNLSIKESLFRLYDEGEQQYVTDMLQMTEAQAVKTITHVNQILSGLEDLKKNPKKYLQSSASTANVLSQFTTKLNNVIKKTDIPSVSQSATDMVKRKIQVVYDDLKKDMGPTHAKIALAMFLLASVASPVPGSALALLPSYRFVYNLLKLK